MDRISTAQAATMPVEIKLNGKTVVSRSDETLIETARHYGIEIPHLCYKEGMRPDDNCRSCGVEIQGERQLMGLLYWTGGRCWRPASAFGARVAPPAGATRADRALLRCPSFCGRPFPFPAATPRRCLPAPPWGGSPPPCTRSEGRGR